MCESDPPIVDAIRAIALNEGWYLSLTALCWDEVIHALKLLDA